MISVENSTLARHRPITPRARPPVHSRIRTSGPGRLIAEDLSALLIALIRPEWLPDGFISRRDENGLVKVEGMCRVIPPTFFKILQIVCKILEFPTNTYERGLFPSRFVSK